MGKKEFTDEQRELIEKLGEDHSMMEFYEVLNKDKTEKSKKDTFRRNVLISFILLPLLFLLIIVSLSMAIQNSHVSLILVYSFPFFAYLLIGRLIYSSGKTARYGYGIRIITPIYCVFVIAGFFHVLEFFQLPMLDLSLNRKIGYLYISLAFCYYTVKSMERKFYHGKNAIGVKDFLFLKMEYALDTIRDIIMNNVLSMEEVEYFKIQYKTGKGLVINLSEFIRLSLIQIEDCLSIAVSKESGKYIIQDEETSNIQKKVAFVFNEVMNSKEVPPNKISLLIKEHENLWFEYTFHKPSKLIEGLIEMVKRRKGQIFPWIAIGGVVLLGYFYISNFSEQYIKALYFIAICAAIIGAFASQFFSKK